MTAIVFALTYLGLALGKIPGLRIDRAGISLVGAAAVLALGLVPFDEAAGAVDARTLALLFGMMVLVGSLRLAGFFELLTGAIRGGWARPYWLLALILVGSGVLSAGLVNDVVCVALTPLVIRLCERLERPPAPYLLALATASNIGSVATITGNPQNIIIGSLSGISYLHFAARLAPVAGLGLVIDFVVIALVFRKSLSGKAPAKTAIGSRRSRVHPGLLVKSLVITGLVLGSFLAGAPIAVVALCAAALCLMGRVRPEKLFHRVDWPLLVLFTGLFIVVHAFERNVVSGWRLENWHWLMSSPVLPLSLLSVVLSNLVSNVPAVLLFKPLIAVMPHRDLAWLALAMSSTLAGNLTLLGSVANLIVVESARQTGTEIRFLEYLKVGIPVTVLTTAAGIAWLSWGIG